jgi:hypothetical protein
MVRRRIAAMVLLLCAGCSVACDGDASGSKAAPARAAPPAIPAAPDALPAEQTGGFDGAKAYEHVARLVALGPRYPGSEGWQKAQEYLRGQLQGYGCAVEEKEFTAATPQGPVRMKNLVVKIAGEKQEILLLGSHYDTVVPSQVKDFVGAVDGASGNGVMLELARLLCAKERKNRLSIWIAFFDGEEAFVDWWKDNDNTYGSREMAARMALDGDLPRVKAMILADLVGEKDAQYKREANSTEWLAELVWGVAAKLGYEGTFVKEEIAGISDDHEPFLKRKVPAVDIIDLEYPHWHTPQDTLDKVSARTLGVTGHVILETVAALERKFSR